MIRLCTGLVTILAAMAWVGCNLSERASDVAGYTEVAGSNGNAEVKLPLDVTLHDINHAELKITSQNTPLIQDRATYVELEFTAKTDISEDAVLSFTLGDDVETSPYMTSSGDKWELMVDGNIKLQSMKAGEKFTAYMMLTAAADFDFQAHLEDIQLLPVPGSSAHVRVYDIERDDDPSAQGAEGPKAEGPISRARKRALEAVGRTVSTTNYINIDVEPLAGYDATSWRDLNLVTEIKEDGGSKKEWLGLILLDYKKALTIEEYSPLQVTIISGGYHLGHNLGGYAKKIMCSGDSCSSLPTMLDIIFPSDAHNYSLHAGNHIRSGRKVEIALPEMKIDEVRSYGLNIKPLTHYFNTPGEFPISVGITRGGMPDDLFTRKLVINGKDGITETRIIGESEDHFRLKARKMSAGGFQVSFTALQDVKDEWGYDTKVRFFCNAKCTHSATTNGKYISNLEREYNVMEMGGYVYSFKVKNSMKKGNSFTLKFDEVYSDGTYRTTYQPYVRYWPKDNEQTSLSAFLGPFTFGN